MGTRSYIEFKDDLGAYYVYKHWDSYPTGIVYCFVNAIPYSWALPRFESQDFAAAFVAANKKAGGGDIYFADKAEPGDEEYFYQITCAKNGQLIIRAYCGTQEIFYGRLKDFVKEYGDSETHVLWDMLVPSDNKLYQRNV